jgi:hypothetical protein
MLPISIGTAIATGGTNAAAIRGRLHVSRRDQGGSMKLVNKKTRKAIEKTVRKAMKKHGPALMASLAAGLASSIATLAKTEAPGRRGMSNLGDLLDQARSAVSEGGRHAGRSDDSQKKRKADPAEERQPAMT